MSAGPDCICYGLCHGNCGDARNVETSLLRLIRTVRSGRLAFDEGALKALDKPRIALAPLDSALRRRPTGRQLCGLDFVVLAPYAVEQLRASESVYNRNTRNDHV